MAAIPVTIVGQMTSKSGKTDGGTSQDVTLIGLMSWTGVGIGGGPIIPQPPSQPPGSPAFPIWGPPGSNFPDKPGYPPVVGGGPIYPPVGGGGPPGYPAFPIAPGYPPGNYPTPPIYWPGYPPGWPPGGSGGWPPVIVPPPGGGDGDKPPPIDWQVAWSPDQGWMVVGVPQFPHPSPSAAPAKPKV